MEAARDLDVCSVRGRFSAGRKNRAETDSLPESSLAVPAESGDNSPVDSLGVTVRHKRGGRRVKGESSFEKKTDSFADGSSAGPGADRLWRRYGLERGNRRRLE